MPNTMKAAVSLVLSLCVLVQGQADMSVYGCSGKNFGGHCETFNCPWQSCCQLPPFFQESLVSVRSTGSYNFILFTTEGCNGHCNDNDNKGLLIDAEGYSNIGPAAFQCVDGPY